MTNIYLTPYVLTITPLNYPKESLDLSEFDGATELIVALKNIVDESSHKLEIAKDTVFKIISNTLDGKHEVLNGICQGGTHGWTATRYNIEKQAYYPEPRALVDTELRNFYYHLFLPSGKKRGLFLCESMGTSSYKTKLWEVMAKGIREKYPDYVLRHEPVTNRAKLEDYLSNLQSIEFVKHGVPVSLAEMYMREGVKTEGFIIKTEITRGRSRKPFAQGLLNLIRQFSESGSRHAEDAFEQMAGFKPSRINLVGKIGDTLESCG